jgi:lipid-binding SYLF domain-containing protein
MNKLISALGIALMLVATFVPPAGAADKEAQRAEVRKNSKAILNQLYKTNPGAKNLVESAAGYATFSNFGMKILVLGGGSGQGVAVANDTQREVFMKMLEVQGGLGFGAKKFRLVFVFENKNALDNFINSGWESSAQATLAASDGKRGTALQGAMAVSPGVWLFQLTDKGLAAEATVKGTKYYKDDSLN